MNGARASKRPPAVLDIADSNSGIPVEAALVAPMPLVQTSLAQTHAEGGIE
jgi:hypothetical protein